MNNETILWNIAPEWENRYQDKKLEKMLLFFADMHKTHAAASKLNVLEDYFRNRSGTAPLTGCSFTVEICLTTMFRRSTGRQEL